MYAIKALTSARKKIAASNDFSNRAKTAQKKDLKASADAKNWTKVVRTVRNPKTGSYSFKASIVHKDKIKEHLGS